ncbi:MAG: M48 family metalloprotease, partial [Pseudomonadales bacterium]|nr:M48 family metalloprotease [Pseudomonadales bacterium]
MSIRSILLTLILTLAPGATTWAGPNDQNLPRLGDSTSGIISLEQERKLGQEFLRSLRAQAPTVSDALLKDYLGHLIYRLASHSRLEDRRLDLIIIDHTELNAFAVPGGVVGVNKGMFLYAENEHEFSSILAHELAHLSQRHFARQVETGRKTSITSLAGMLAGIVLIATGSGDAGMA